MQAKKFKQEVSEPWGNWRGLGIWNYYFIIKFALLWYGKLNFHPLANLEFLMFLLFPLPSAKWHRWRQWIALPIGIALLYYDTWLPSIWTLKTQGAILKGFSLDYVFELANRFINWEMIGVGFILLVAYLFISQWLRFTVFIVAGIVWLNLLTLSGPAFSLLPTTGAAVTENKKVVVANVAGATEANNNLPPTSANLTAYLEEFYKQEKLRRTLFPQELPADSQPFDIVIVHICSLAWSDLESQKALLEHPLWKKFDIVFNQFNSAASYSGPSAIRLLRSSCGQSSHVALYEPTNQQCYLMDNLKKLGFVSQFMVDYSGDKFTQDARQYGNLTVPLISQSGIADELIAFNGNPITNDQQLLGRWLSQREKLPAKRAALYFNLIPLHDGNRFIGQNAPAPYLPRGEQLFNQLDDFFATLEKSGRKVVVIFIPEHGANLTGDKLQIPGLRDLPSPNITHVPVAIKFIGMKAPHAEKAWQISAPSSYLAISDLLARVVDGKIFDQPEVDWSALTVNLPQTPSIAENDGSVVVEYQGKPYIRLNGETQWLPYPQ